MLHLMKEMGEFLQRLGFFNWYNSFKSSNWRNLNNIDIKLHTTHGLLQQRLSKLTVPGRINKNVKVTSVSSFRNCDS